MTATAALERLRELQTEIERNAAITLGSAEQRRLEAEDRLRELERYLHEYRASFTACLSSGRSAAYAQEYLAFIARLDAALVLQRARLAGCERDGEQARLQRQAAARERTTTERLLARRQAVIASKELQRERREIDDRVSARYVRVDV